MRKSVYFLFGLSLLSFSSLAWDGATSGKISKIDVAPASNYGFRVYLDGDKKLCGNANSWAYINGSDSNYNTFVSVLLSAKASNATITIYANQEKQSGEAYCQIGYISMS
ncbi:hypothetical protein [Aeromonas dhakensis]|uniref:hypothetical protein n=1 Tax=Aeromonas dhakensis TaxID=196024 RepID=UPI003BA384D5